ncbi:hypothetical protein Pint_33813 [Pistacia integerrima]|uniref:Uncharacterized protein n=1 Tax=Pistacia integerrima TaxID=434235 RepID=A0ACC0X673_9ROSI|nr:hypothetical protein Pint_33813 [Pistacia integerrima]
MISVIIDVWLVNVSFRSRVKEYLPIVGLADFNKLSAKLIFGADNPTMQSGAVATVQCLSGTGSRGSRLSF